MQVLSLDGKNTFCIFFFLYDTKESNTTLKFSNFGCCGSNCALPYWRFHKPIHCNILVKLKTACIDFFFLFSSYFFFFLLFLVLIHVEDKGSI